jgi:hypothetical protein
MSSSGSINAISGQSTMLNIDEINIFQAVRRTGRRNAIGDLGEQIIQGSTHLWIEFDMSHNVSHSMFSQWIDVVS